MIRVAPMTRQGFLLSGALAAGAAAGPWVSTALGQAGGIDDEILNFALTLERLEARFYQLGLQRVKGLSGENRRILTEIRDNESEHVDILVRLVSQFGATPAPEPTLDFGDAFASEARFLEVSQQLEDTGVAAYDGAAPRISERDILDAAGAIAQVEARHAGIVRFIRDEPITPGPFDRALTTEQVLRRVKPFMRG
ncbi:MAG TPA: ferritin-like domain-containing protein [Solirubrobacteraceae bacterium]|jgi:rubrerythrin